MTIERAGRMRARMLARVPRPPQPEVIQSSMALSLEFIEKLPKTDLHCHLDGSLRISTILELAEKQKVRLPADHPDELFQLIWAGSVCTSLEDYLKAFDITLSVMQTEESLYRTA